MKRIILSNTSIPFGPKCSFKESTGVKSELEIWLLKVLLQKKNIKILLVRSMKSKYYSSALFVRQPRYHTSLTLVWGVYTGRRTKEIKNLIYYIKFYERRI